MDNIESVVEMFKDRFGAIPETTYETSERFKKTQGERGCQEKVDAQVAGEKRGEKDREDWRSG